MPTPPREPLVTGQRRPIKPGTTEAEAQREGERSRLLALVAARADRVPCVTSPEPAAWTTDDDDTQRVAAAACSPCPILAACRAYGAAWPAEEGVYGGRTQSERRRGARPTTKEKTA